MYDAALHDVWMYRYVPGILRLGEMSDIAGLIAPRPFLAIAGALDQGTAAESKKLVELAPDGELVIIPGANHLVSFQRPDLVNPVLLRFLERCTA